MLNNLKNKKIDHILHIGAGHCTELDDYIELDPKNITLVEADPNLASTLKNRIKGHKNVQLIQSAVTDNPELTSLYRNSLPFTNSLHPAKGLQSIYPNIKSTDAIAIKTIKPKALVDSVSINDQTRNTLVIDAPAEEYPLLKALFQSKQLYLFQYIQLHCMESMVYENAKVAKEIINWLDNIGYQLLDKNDIDTPERPVWTFILDKNKLDNYHQVENNKSQIDRLNQKITEITKQKKQLAAQKNNQAKLATERQQQIDKLNNEKAELTKQKEQLATQKNNQAKIATERQQQIQKLNQEKTELAKQKEQLTAEKNNQTKLATEKQQQIDKLNQEKTELTKQNGQLKEELEKTKQSIHLNLNLLASKEADLKDLQSRYKESIETQESQNELLQQLSERLTQASHYFHQMPNTDQIEQQPDE